MEGKPKQRIRRYRAGPRVSQSAGRALHILAHLTPTANYRERCTPLRSEEPVIKTPIRSPRANAIAERWVRTVREECLDWMLVLGRNYLEAVLRDYVRHYNEHRPHRGLRLEVPTPLSAVTSAPPSLSDVGRRDVLGGIIHEYHAAA